MTETEKRQNRTMADVSHTHPHFHNGGVNDLFRRGPRAMTDGGERNEKKRQTMADVSHTPPTGDREVNRVFSRGGEPVAADEDEDEDEEDDEDVAGER